MKHANKDDTHMGSRHDDAEHKHHHDEHAGSHGGTQMSGHNHGHGAHDHTEHHRRMAQDFKRRFWITAILTIPILLFAPLIRQFFGLSEELAFPGDRWLLFVLSTAVFIYGGYPFLKGLVTELKNRLPGMMTLIGVAITVAYVYSSAVVFGLPGKTFFWELATLVVVMLFGHWIEMRSVIGASRALEELAKLVPATAHRLGEDEAVHDVPVADLQPGDNILVKPGERIPADGTVIKGSSSVNEAMITGESKPVGKQKDDDVVGGAVNEDGSLTVKVTKVGKDSYLSQIVEMVRRAQAGKTGTQRLADRAALWLTIIALSGGIITLGLWLFVANRDFAFALERMVTVMVITCPHALGLAIPLVVAVSTALSAKAGLLIRNRGPFEQARKISSIVFDKTGTLTKGEFAVTKMEIFTDHDNRDALLKLAASVEADSEHPIGRAIANAAGETYGVDEFSAIPGKGAEGVVDGKNVKIVSPDYVKEKKLQFDESRLADMYSRGDTVVFIIVDDDLKGAIGLQDVIRPEAKQAVDILKKAGIRTILITGDAQQVADNVGQQIEIDEVFAEILPDEKAKKIEEIQARGERVAMVGDGINDAPALAQADLGIAIGAGTDVAAETADVVLVDSDPRDVIRLLELSRVTYRKMVQNLIWATGYNAFAIPIAAGALFFWGILLNPAVGALLMSISTVIVAINARIMQVPEK